MTGTKPANRRKTPTKSKSETASGGSRGQRASAHEAKDTAASKDAAPDAREPKGRRRPRRGPRDGLTPLQARFVQEYLIDLNAAQAARRAGYSARSARTTGHRLLQHPKIAAKVARAQERRAARTRVSADRVVLELAKVAFGDPRRLLSWGPEGVVLRDSGELTEAEAALVSEVSETRGTRRVKLHCKLTALTALARHLGLFGNGRRGAAAGGPGEPERDPEGGEEAAEADDARQRLARRIAGLAARLGAGGSPR